MEFSKPMRELLSGYVVSYNRRHRILESGEFVERIIKEDEAKITYQLLVKEYHERIDELIARISKSENVSVEELKGGRRRKQASRVRGRISIGPVKEHGAALGEAARRLDVSTSVLSVIIRRAPYWIKAAGDVMRRVQPSNYARYFPAPKAGFASIRIGRPTSNSRRSCFSVEIEDHSTTAAPV
jgi:hypothetical protein